MSSDDYCKCYSTISITCGKCNKQFKIPRSKDEQIKELKERLRKCREDAFCYKIEIQELENESDDDSDTTINLDKKCDSSSSSSDSSSDTD